MSPEKAWQVSQQSLSTARTRTFWSIPSESALFCFLCVQDQFSLSTIQCQSVSNFTIKCLKAQLKLPSSFSTQIVQVSKYFFNYALLFFNFDYNFVFSRKNNQQVIISTLLYIWLKHSMEYLLRCTKDMNYVDEHLPPTLNDCVTIFLFQLGIMTVVVTTNYYLIAPCIILVFVLWKIRKFFIKSARNIKRLDSICKAYFNFVNYY